MKKLLTALLVTGSALSFGQDYNPYVNLSSVNPSPLQPAEENGAGTLTFHVGNSGTLELYVPGVTPPMKVTMTLSYGLPNNVNPIAAIGGTYASKFSWVYDGTIKTYQGTQVSPIPAGGDGTITVAYKVETNSSISLPQNGFNVNVVPPAYSNGVNTTNDDVVNKYVYTVTVISGTVFNDVNGMTDLLVNGTGTNAGGLNAVLINNLGNVAAVTAVAADGTYAFPEVPDGNYDVMITIANPAIGTMAPASSVLPVNWVNTGEGTLPVGDGTINGMTSVIKPVSSVTGVNFGIEQRPTALSSTTATFNNPTGTNTITVPASAFGGTDPSTGTVTNMTFTTFPANVTSIIIGATTYNAGNWPSGGVTVPAPGGQPTPVVKIDPIDGSVIVTIPFKVTDNATFTSTNTGIVTIPFGAPLPLDLIAFDARKDGSFSLLTWQTANEDHVKSFEIERSITGSNYNKVGTVAAANTDGVNDYKFYDRTPNTGVNFYRLRMVDADGKFTYSNVKTVEFADGKMEITMYPNPAASELNITMKTGNCADMKNASVSVIDISGRTVMTQAWSDVCRNPTKVLNLNGLTDGAYYVNITNADNNLVLMNKKIIKSK
jgi:hypothetical protein